MAPLLATSGAYTARGYIANAQRCVNLYPEINPQDTKPPVPITHYMRPGKRLVGIPPALGVGRGVYTATNGDLYVVINNILYFVDDNFAFAAVGDVGAGTSVVSMADNGEDVGDEMVVVDGSSNGWVVTLSTRAFAPVSDPTGTFVGSNRVDYLSGFFLFNAPDTPYWYTSLQNSVSFNALDVASKSSYADNIATLGVRQREVWLIGAQTSTEPWYLSGAADFAFEAVSSSFVPYGCIAKYSMASIDASLLWLSQDLKGKGIVVQSEGYQAKRISTHAIEDEFSKYPTLTDAVAGSYQVEGHTFYVLHFPTADKTWAYDLSTRQWAEQTWLDNNGVEHCDRARFYTHAHGRIIGQDWETGVLYELSNEVFQDNGAPILCRRGFPHVVNEMRRMTHWGLTVDVQGGTVEDGQEDPQIGMRYSDDRGKTWSDPDYQPFGKIGEYEASPYYPSLGMARDRVYEVMWAENIKAVLNGLYLETEPCES